MGIAARWDVSTVAPVAGTISSALGSGAEGPALTADVVANRVTATVLATRPIVARMATATGHVRRFGLATTTAESSSHPRRGVRASRIHGRRGGGGTVRRATRAVARWFRRRGAESSPPWAGSRERTARGPRRAPRCSRSGCLGPSRGTWRSRLRARGAPRRARSRDASADPWRCARRGPPCSRRRTASCSTRARRGRHRATRCRSARRPSTALHLLGRHVERRAEDRVGRRHRALGANVRGKRLGDAEIEHLDMSCRRVYARGRGSPV